MPMPRPLSIEIALFAIAAANEARDHEDYETVITTLTTPTDEPFEVIHHWTDGIMFSDPVKLILRTPGGEVLAETEYRRNLVVTQTSDDRWIAFTASPWNVFYHRAWWIDSGELVPASDFAHIPLAFAAGLRQHWMAYTSCVSLLVAAFAAWRHRETKHIAWRCASLVALVCFAIPIGVIVVWKWIEVLRAARGAGLAAGLAAGLSGDFYFAMAMTAVVSIFAFFCYRWCRTSSGTFALAANLSLVWMLFLTLYFDALPLSILLVAAVVSGVLWLAVEKVKRVGHPGWAAVS
jgi:hypothetical protein